MDSAAPADRTPDDRTPDDRAPAHRPGPDAGPEGPGGSTAELDRVDERGAGPDPVLDPDVTDDPEAGPDQPADPARDQVVPAAIRSQRSPRDIAISLLVLLVPIALVIGFGRAFLGADEPNVIDAAPTVQRARAANAFPVSEPAGLSDGWRTVSATFQRAEAGATLRIGYLTPAGHGVQLVQSNVPVEQLLPAELTGRGQPQGPTELGGQSWQRYTARAGESALVLLEPGRTVIVIGSVPENDLRRLANALR